MGGTSGHAPVQSGGKGDAGPGDRKALGGERKFGYWSDTATRCTIHGAIHLTSDSRLPPGTLERDDVTANNTSGGRR